MSSIFVGIPLGVLAGGLLLAFVSWYFERRQYNGGVCAKSGLPWIAFDTDSQGGQLFTDNAGNYLAVSWPFILKENKDDTA